MYVQNKRIQESFYFIGGNFSQKIQNSIEKPQCTDKTEIQVKTREQNFDHFRTNVIETGCSAILNKMS